MKVRGIRISDDTDGVVSVELPDILKEIRDGHAFYWLILFLEGPIKPDSDKFVIDFMCNIDNAIDGLYVNWGELNLLSKSLYQIIDSIIIGSKNKNLLNRYENHQDMYETCDIVINMFDSSYWEVFSNNEDLINRLAIKFNDVKFLETDFEK